MPIIRNPHAPKREQALVAAQELRERLRSFLPEYQARIDEAISGQFNVIIEVPYRVEQPTWQEREEARQT